MRVAKKVVAAVYIDCPKCGEGHASPAGGLFLWDLTDSEVQGERDKVQRCGYCGVRFALPATL